MLLATVAVALHLAASLHWTRPPILLFVFVLLLSHSLTVQTNYNNSIFPFDYLSPYPDGRHGSGRTVRDISECQHTTWKNRTFETLRVSLRPPSSKEVSYKLHKFADITDRPTGKKYLIGTVAYVEDPYHTFSILEPGKKGGCSSGYFATRSTVQETASNRKYGCKLGANAGYFVMSSGKCLGNVVSDGRIVQTANNQQNANFGIRQDGTIVVGYIPDEEILNTTNPFRQLVTGVIWLVRNGSNFVNESKRLECASHEDTGRMETFVNVLSARSAIGHDASGRLVMAQVEGQTHRRGANLVEFADLLIRHGVVNAINLDGGGSSTLVEDNVLINYPSDHCPGDGQYRCPRAVSTALCVHDVECLEPDCSGHGSCDLTLCTCDPPWTGNVCDKLNCTLTNCSMHGTCHDGKCSCEDGWRGDLCSEACPSNRYGPNCQNYCWCYGNSHCHLSTGHCVCPPGYKGYSCYQECEEGHYGPGCTEHCTYPHCSGHGHCSKLNGSCLCEDEWTGADCNTSRLQSLEGSGSGQLPIYPTFTTPQSLQPSLVSSPSPSITDSSSSAWAVSGSPSVQNESSTATNDSQCVCRKQCPDEGATKNCSAEAGLGVVDACNSSRNQTQALLPVDGPLQWVVAITLLIALLTLMLHSLLCYITRRWAYMAVARSNPALASTEELQPVKRKKIKRRKPRPRFAVPLLQYSSSTDCSL